MNSGQRYWYLPGGALVLVVVSFWSSDPELAEGAAAGAALLAGAFLVLTLLERLAPTGPGAPEVVADSLTLLAGAFAQGRYGREAILARLEGLDLETGAPALLGPEEREEVLTSTDAQFVAHVERRLTAIEARS